MSSKCYIWDAGAGKSVVADPNYDQPCPTGGGCCSPGDTCMSDFMCKHRLPATDPNRPDYYINACTDPTYTASACVKFCFKYVRTGVVYNSTSDLWSCCGTVGGPGNYTTTCATPTNDTFALVPPNQLIDMGIAGIGFNSSATQSTTPSSSATSNTAPATSLASQVSKGGLSTAAQVGLGVGLGVAVALLIALVAFILRRRSSSKRSRASNVQPATEDYYGKEIPYVSQKKKDAPPSYPTTTRNGNDERGVYITKTTQELSNNEIRYLELPSYISSGRAELP